MSADKIKAVRLRELLIEASTDRADVDEALHLMDDLGVSHVKHVPDAIDVFVPFYEEHRVVSIEDFGFVAQRTFPFMLPPGVMSTCVAGTWSR